VTTTLRALPPFASSADDTLVTARHVAPDLERLARGARAPLQSLRPTALNLQSVTHQAAPILTELDQRAMRDLLWFVENWALGLKGRDALGHFIGADLQLDPSIVISALDDYLNNGGLLASLNRHKAAATVRSAGTSSAAGPAAAPAAAPSTPASARAATSASATAPAAATRQPQHGATPPASSSSPTSNAQQLLDYLLGQ
jgi:hypothetical protein